jgi:hypothetical protein
MSRAWTLILGGLSLVVSIDAFPQAQSKSAPGSGVEDIYIARAVRESRDWPSAFCAEARTGFPTGGGAEDKFTFRSTATRGSDGLLTNSNVKEIGTLHGCFGPTADPLVWNMYAEGALGTTTFKGRGECVQKKDYPEPGMTPTRCSIDLYDLSNGYIGGTATSNAINSYSNLGEWSLPAGYTQIGIYTFRLWKRR